MTGQAAWFDLRVRMERVPRPNGRRKRAELSDCPTCRARGRRGNFADSAGFSRIRGPRDRRVRHDLPAGQSTDKTLGLVIDLDTCVGCQACVTACKGWNDQGYGVPLSDQDPYGADPSGTFLNRVHSYQVEVPMRAPQIVNFPRSCLHCADAPCVTVCPTGASYKRAEDGIVLVNEDACIGCGLCAWACPYGAREMDAAAGVMKKCTLCVDRIYNENLPEEDREPACVRTCPTGARHFGDLSDPDSAVSVLVADAGRLCPDARDGHQARQPLSAAAQEGGWPGRPVDAAGGCAGDGLCRLA